MLMTLSSTTTTKVRFKYQVWLWSSFFSKKTSEIQFLPTQNVVRRQKILSIGLKCKISKESMKRKYEKKAKFTFDTNWAWRPAIFIQARKWRKYDNFWYEFIFKFWAWTSLMSNLVFETDLSQLSCNTFVSFWVLWSLK